jgi:WD40 repeat protein
MCLLLACVGLVFAAERVNAEEVITEPIRTFSGHTSWVLSVAFSPDGGKVLTGGGDSTAKLWDVSTGACIRTFSGHTDSVLSVVFSPDGGKVLTGARWPDCTAKLWDVSTGACIRTFSGHTNWVNSVAYSPDGGKVLTGAGGPWSSADNTAKLWDASTGACIRTFSGHTDWVTSVAYSPDGTKLLTGSYDKTAKLWWTSGVVYTLTVNNGTGSGVYDEDTVVSIQATVPSGYRFRDWTGDVAHVADVTKASTTVTMLADTSVTARFLMQADVNGDDCVNVTDLLTVRNCLGKSGSLPADVNEDGIVNVTDLLLVRNSLGKGSRCQ